MGFGIKATPPGIDVRRAKERELSLYTKYFTLKQKDFPDFPNTVTVPDGSQNAFITFTHNLGYVPNFSIYMEDSVKTWFRIPGISTDGTRGSISDSTNNKIVALVGQPGGYDGNITFNINCIVTLEEGIQV